MNRKEFLESGGYSIYNYKVRKLLKQWKLENNITERCVAHHRDDTEECKKYNEEHYELFGFEIDENGILKFEEGKYVQFMTKSAHSSHHHKGKYISDEIKRKLHFKLLGENNPRYGKHHSEETRKKISEHNKGKVMSAETRKKISKSKTGRCEAVKSFSYMYNIYKLNDGKLKWNEFQRAISNGDITFQLQPISVYL